MSKLISKIEEKLGGSNSSEEPSKLQKTPPTNKTASSNNDSGAVDTVRHPISSASGPTGTAVKDTYSSPTTTTSSRDGPRATIPSTSGGYVSSTTTTGGGPSVPFHPYSAKGQQIAADAAANQDRAAESSYPGTGTHNLGGSGVGTTRAGGMTGVGVDSAYGNVGTRSEEPVLGTAVPPSHMASAERRPFIEDSAGASGAGALGSNTGNHPIDSAGVRGAGQSSEEMAKKMADAYQAGYRDAMEHMKLGR